ncbi:thymidylate synthase [Streptomyces filamentosus]|uniref:thymidylate synthase n=1 Tax=Streptomyces filamentosus TaxID=67294 RepID=A0A919BRL3_STRFL|nr:thymidylate synthase [Streptomyces filamentosus]GHG05616.1 thymidylate synthase [Streptomyces filamentosus]
MLTPPTYQSVEGAYLDLLRLASQSPEHHIDARGNAAREVLGVTFRLPDPRQRLPYLAERKANPVFQFAEALWYLAGRRDLEMIGYYAPSMRSSSADGVHLGGSAYGHTLFTPAAGDTLSSFDRVLDLLRTESDSKRGYLPVFSPDEHAIPDNIDMACLAGLHLLVRSGRLHMVCHMRANDLDCGLLSDVFSFTMIQEYAAIQLGLELGSYTHTIGSAHVNEANMERVKRVLDEAQQRPTAPDFDFPVMPHSTSPDTITELLVHEELLRTNTRDYRAAEIAHLGFPAYWQQVLLLFEAYRQIQYGEPEAVTRDVLDALHPGLRWLLAHRWAACRKAVTAL